MWYIGIDLGTSNTYIAACNYVDGKNGKICKIYTNESKDFFPAELKDQDYNIPTRITVDVTSPDRRTLVGGETQKNLPYLRVFSDLKTVAREITPPNGHFGALERAYEYPFEHCELESQLEFGHKDCSETRKVSNLLTCFFKRVLHINDGSPFNINRGTVAKIVIGCPANNKECESAKGYKNVLKDILADCFCKTKREKEEFRNNNIDVKEEPVLAGVTYLYGDGLNEKNVLVIDIGGGTTDFAIVKYKGENEPEVVANDSCDVAGNAIDELIWALLPDGLARSKDQCRQAKEQLFSEREKSNNISGGDFGYLSNGRSFRLIEQDGDAEKAQTQNYISLREGKLVINNSPQKWVEGHAVVDKKTGKKDNYKKIYTLNQVVEKIGERLKDLLNRTKKKYKIDTVFFVGGTTAIKSLRDDLTNIVEEMFPGYEFSVETVFPNVKKSEKSQRKLYVPGGSWLTITHYNAVAVGACAKALGNDRIVIKPSIEFQWTALGYGIDKPNKDILLKTSAPVPLAYVPVEKDTCQRWFSKSKMEREYYREKIEHEITWTVGNTLHRYRLDYNTIKKITNEGEMGLLMVLNSVYNEFRFDVYACRTPPQSTLAEYLSANHIEQTIRSYANAEPAIPNVKEINNIN